MSYAVLIIFVLSLTAPGNLQAADLVSFNSATSPPSPLQVRKAKAQGKTLIPVPGTTLNGWLYRPPGSGPFPAIVLLHDCRGIQNYQKNWALELAAWGWVALLVDSYGPRGFQEICARSGELRYSEVVGGRLADAFGAHRYLQTLTIVDNTRIGVIGWDVTALKAVFNSARDQGFEDTFRAAVAFYPYCALNRGADFVSPVLILIGDVDDSVKPENCTQMLVDSKNGSTDVKVVLYPGVLRGFDDPGVGERLYLPDAYNPHKNPAVGFTLGYNRSAHDDAQKRVKEFLEKQFQ